MPNLHQTSTPQINTCHSITTPQHQQLVQTQRRHRKTETKTNFPHIVVCTATDTTPLNHSNDDNKVARANNSLGFRVANPKPQKSLL